MSYTLEYGRKCFVMPKGSTLGSVGDSPRWEPDYYLFINEGCNNIIPRPKNWHLAGTGWNYAIVARVCERAAFTEGGMLKLGEAWVSPEDYLALYRQVIAEAEELTVEGLRKHLGARALGFTWLKEANVARLLADDYRRQCYEKLLANFERVEGDFQTFELIRPLEKLEDFFLWLDGHWVIRQAEGCFSIFDARGAALRARRAEWAREAQAA